MKTSVSVALCSVVALSARLSHEGDTRSHNLTATGMTMDCGSASLCGVLTLQSGLGQGVYQHNGPCVHGLWPQVAPYGNSNCVAPTGGTADPVSPVSECYANTGGVEADQLKFEVHEWDKHGQCAGMKDSADFLTQVCGLASKPLAAMASQQNLLDMAAAVEKLGYEVFNVDSANDQLEISACQVGQTGQWVLVPSAQFSVKCGSG